VIRVFLDATVLFSAARNPGGANRDLLRIANKRGDVLLLSTWMVIDEADIKLMYRGEPNVRAELEHLVETYVEKCPLPSAELVQEMSPLTPDPDDAPVLAGALSAKADWLVTSNKDHFKHLYGGTVRGVLVLDLSMAIARLLANPWRQRDTPPD
jgi:predicted nucleic acid-binding protein